MKSPAGDLIQRLELSRMDDLLRNLIAKSAKDAAAKAFVRLVCDTQQYEGIPVKIQTLSGEEYLGLYQLDGGIRGQEALVLLPLKTITAVVLLNMRDHMDLLTLRAPRALLG